MADNTIYKRSAAGRKEETRVGDSLSLTYGGNSVAMKKKILIGRALSCDIVLNDSLVSRKHCVIELIGDVHYIRDLNSTNKTYVNKNPLREGKPTKLAPGDVINIGKTEFTIR